MKILIKKVCKEIQKLEQQKIIKTQKKNDLEKEINIIDLRLKELNSLKNQYDKIQNGINQFFDSDINKD